MFKNGPTKVPGRQGTGDAAISSPISVGPLSLGLLLSLPPSCTGLFWKIFRSQGELAGADQ